MGAWYTIGLLAGVGAALGVAAVGVLGAARLALAAALLVAVAAGAGLAVAVFDWPEAVAAAVGATLGAAGAAPLVRGSLERGGTRGGTAVLVAAAALVVAALALIPLVGYVEAIALPALAARLRRRAGSRYAGLRILARD